MLLITQFPLRAADISRLEASRGMLECATAKFYKNSERAARMQMRIVIEERGMGLLNGMIHDGSCREQEATTQFQVESSASAFINDGNEIKTQNNEKLQRSSSRAVALSMGNVETSDNA